MLWMWFVCVGKNSVTVWLAMGTLTESTVEINHILPAYICWMAEKILDMLNIAVFLCYKVQKVVKIH